MTTTALTTTTDKALTITDHDPIERWDAAVSRYLETRKGGPEGNTARAYGRTLRVYKDFALESGLSPWVGDAIIAYNKLQNGLRKANGGNLADDTIAARLTHVQGFFRWAYIHGATPLTPEMVTGFIHKPRVKQLSPRDILDASEVRAMLKVTRSAEDPTQARGSTHLSGSWPTRS
jgi:site-specific recombinase XerD